ncbi:hypothetical protein ACHAW5_009956 [Stephanodiscus triporus]|uniref:Uncharacterized protein n=1 Tax=Stephanodiscus triporus TaxID=2934178 RepID=A0ABD3Q2C8_9STRA
MTSNSKTPTSRPGAMSLLDKYSSINASIEDARRRVAEVRSALERANEKNISLREERNGMLAEAERAASDQMRLAAELKEAKVAHRAKLAEMEGVRRDHRIARSEYDGARRRIDEERIAFFERCREFRSAIKRVRVASSIFVLEGGEDFDPTMVATDEVDRWRELLQDEDEDDSDEDEEEQEGDDNSNQDLERSDKRKRKKPDPEVEQAERDEKESRHALIEVECALHDERMKIDEAAKRSNARNQRLTQQRAQLQRHRKEVEEMEREIQLVREDIVQENQLANTFEKECNRRKQLRDSNDGGLRGVSPRDNLSSCHPPGTSRSNNNHHTPQAMSASRYQQRVVTNPYKQASRAPNNAPPNVPSNDRSGKINHDIRNDAANASLPYASDMMRGMTSDSRRGHPDREAIQHPHRGGRVRNQRQFGTSIGVSLDSGGMMADDLLRRRTTAFAPGFAQPDASSSSNENSVTGLDDNDGVSDVSSASSDEGLLSFDVFGKK